MKRMETRKNLEELLSVIEAVRANKYTDVPEALVEKIVIAQYENQEESDRAKARNQTRKIIAEYMNELK